MVLFCGGLTCASVPVQVPSWSVVVDGLHGDVVRGVGDQILQHGVVSVPGNDGLRMKTAQSQSQSQRADGSVLSGV